MQAMSSEMTSNFHPTTNYCGENDNACMHLPSQRPLPLPFNSPGISKIKIYRVQSMVQEFKISDQT